MLTRCVGGPLHNTFVDLADRGIIQFAERPPGLDDLMCTVPDKITPLQYTMHRYYRHQYVTDRGTRWWQYIHESVHHHDTANYQETFPQMPDLDLMPLAIIHYRRLCRHSSPRKYHV